MIIQCPGCQARYRISPAANDKPRARVRCPGCQEVFEITLTNGRPEPVKAAPPSAAAPAAAAATGRHRVLVVDDARFFREMICDLLSELPVRLDAAGDGKEALAIIRAHPPDLLLIDLNIPGLSGQELIAAVRREPACRSVRILAMSSVQRGEETAQDIRRLGADDFINKSFKPADLQSRVRQLLGL